MNLLKSLFLLASCLVLNAKTLVVCPNGCSFDSLHKAVEKAQPFDTILVRKGHYEVIELKIMKPLTLIGEDFPVLDAKMKNYAIQVQTDSFSIEGFKIINIKSDYVNDLAAILVTRSAHFTIKNNIFENVFWALLIEKSRDGEIYQNKILGKPGETEEAFLGNGIHLWHCQNFKIHHNEITNQRDGIYFEFVEDSEIYENKSHHNLRYGLHFMFSNHDKYYNNEFHYNGAGVAVMFSKKIEMKNNLFHDNWGGASYGLLLKEIYDAVIENNVFRKNTIAINIEGSTRIDYQYNEFIRNGWAIAIRGGCYQNSFKRNNFIGNSFDVSYHGARESVNEFSKNYWDNYTGYDLDKDNFGDVPFRPVNLFSYVVNLVPEAIVLLRSLFAYLIDFSEKVSPVLTPDNLKDNEPQMFPVKTRENPRIS